MTDEERLIEAVMKTINSSGVNDAWARAAARARIELLRQVGIILTLPPVPEPTYTIQMTQQERDALVNRLRYAVDQGYWRGEEVAILNRLVNATPDEDAE